MENISDFYGEPSDVFKTLSLFLCQEQIGEDIHNIDLRLVTIRDEVIDYLASRDLDVSSSHSNGRDMARPYIGPLFKVELPPNGTKYEIYVPCSRPSPKKEIDYISSHENEDESLSSIISENGYIGYEIVREECIQLKSKFDAECVKLQQKCGDNVGLYKAERKKLLNPLVAKEKEYLSSVIRYVNFGKLTEINVNNLDRETQSHLLNESCFSVNKDGTLKINDEEFKKSNFLIDENGMLIEKQSILDDSRFFISESLENGGEPAFISRLNDTTAEYRLLVDENGFMDDSSKIGPYTNILEAIVLSGMIPVKEDWVEEYDIDKHIANNEKNKKNKETINQFKKILPKIQDELTTRCCRFYQITMSFVNTHHIPVGKKDRADFSKCEEKLSRWFTTLIKVNKDSTFRKKDFMNNFRRNREKGKLEDPIPLYKNDGIKLKGLNFSEVLAEIDVAANYISASIKLNKELEAIDKYRINHGLAPLPRTAKGYDLETIKRYKFLEFDSKDKTDDEKNNELLKYSSNEMQSHIKRDISLVQDKETGLHENRSLWLNLTLKAIKTIEAKLEKKSEEPGGRD